jgi:phasin family protein
MHYVTEQLAATSKAGAEALLTITQTQFAAFERLWNLNISTTKAAFEDTINQTKALLSVNDAQELTNVTTASVQPAWAKATTYSRNFYEAVTQTQAEVTKLAENRAEEVNKTVASMLETLSKNAPPVSDIAVAAVRSAMTAANSAYGTFSNIVKQVNQIAGESVVAASETIAKETSKRKAA